jgi:hypothetical protein
VELRHAARLAVEAIEAGETFDYLESVVYPALVAALSEPGLTVEELQQALIDAQLVDPDSVDMPDEYDDGHTLACIDDLYRRLYE